jgi:hypothetical protein
MNFRNWLYVSGPSLDRVNDLDGDIVDSYAEKFRKAVSEGYVPVVYIRYQANGKTSFRLLEYKSFSRGKYGERGRASGVLEQHFPLSTVLDSILLHTLFT